VESLSGLDARFLYSETPAAHMHTMKVVVVDPSERQDPLTAEVLAREMASYLHEVPALRRRAVPLPQGVDHPVWVETAVDPADHLAWRRLDPPGDRRQLAAIIAEVASTPLPRDRPLWHLTVVEGLEGDQLAFVMKLHHALADGVAAESMLERAFGRDRTVERAPAGSPAPTPHGRALRRHGLRVRVRRLAGLPSLTRRSVQGMRAARRWRAEQEVKPTAMFSGPRTALNASLTPVRTFAMTTVAMADIAAVRTRHGVTVNDVLLAACGGALRRHLGAPAERRGLVAGVPIGTMGDGRLSGNRLDHMAAALHTDVGDPVERLLAVSKSAAVARRAREALGSGLFEDRADLTPPVLYPLAIRLWAGTRLANRVRPPLNLIVSNVPGPREPLAMEGGVVTELWSVGPILEGIGLNITAWSYHGDLYVSVLGCPRTLPDPWVLIAHLDAAFHELVAGPSEGSVSPDGG
jgi:diacylglycerol O-acyltransferase